MTKSLLDRLKPETVGLVKNSVYYDPNTSHGLRWSEERYSRSGRGHSIGDPVTSSNFIIGNKSFQCAEIVLVLNGIWPECGDYVAARKDRLGSWGDLSNLHWSARGDVRAKNCEAIRQELVQQILGKNEPDLGERYRLNKLCKKGHSWKGCNLSLQRRDGQEWRCFICEDERKAQRIKDGKLKEWYHKNADRERKKARDRMEEKRKDPIEKEKQKERSRLCNARLRAQKGRESRAKGLDGLQLPPGTALGIREAAIARDLIAQGQPPDYKTLKPLIEERLQFMLLLKKLMNGQTGGTSVAELVNLEQKRYWKENPTEHQKKLNKEKYMLHEKRMHFDPIYRENYLLYHRQKSKRRKALLRGSIGHQLTGSQVRRRFEQFGHSCAYCGNAGDLHIEHVVPVSKGGTHVMGNIVPACPSCNFNKAAREVECWYRAQPFFCEQRWKKIRRVLGVAKGSPNQLALL